MKVEFLAALASTSAITVSGDNSGGKIKLLYDDQQTPEVVKLVLFSGKLFKVTIEEVE